MLISAMCGTEMLRGRVFQRTAHGATSRPIDPHIIYARKRVRTVDEEEVEEQHNEDTMVEGEDEMNNY